MSERFDRLRSIVRRAADLAGDRVRALPPIQAARKAIDDFGRQRSSLRDEQLSATVARGHGVVSASATARRGAIHLDLAFDDGRRAAASLYCEGARFAPRGAKEVAFRVEPASASGDPRVQDAVGALAGLLAKTLWGPLIRGEDFGADAAVVDRTGDVLRVDLRNVPAVRKARSSAAAMFLDVLELGAIHVREGEIALELKMPVGLVGR